MAGASARKPGRRILVVDDSVDSAETLGELLKIWGHDVRLAHDGPGAVDAARDYRPDVILLDIGLPGMDGFAVAAQLREEGIGGRMLVALCLGYASVTWTIAPVFDEVYQADLRLLRDLEAQARASGAQSLFVCARETTANANPHAIDFRGGPPRLSAFLTEWSAEGILEWHATLPVTRDDGLRGDCCVHCDWTRDGSFRAMRLEEGPVLCGCAP